MILLPLVPAVLALVILVAVWHYVFPSQQTHEIINLSRRNPRPPPRQYTPQGSNTEYNTGLLVTDIRKNSLTLLYASVSTLRGTDDAYVSSMPLTTLKFPTTQTFPVMVLVYPGADF